MGLPSLPRRSVEFIGRDTLDASGAGFDRQAIAVLIAFALCAAAGLAAAQISPTAPAALNTNAATDSGGDYVPQVSTDGLGNWVAVWYSDDALDGTLGGDEDILVSRSTNNGATWTAPAALNTNAATDSGDDFIPMVTTDGLGNWVAVWNSTDTLDGLIGANRDILVSRSTDNGATWTAPAALNTNAATDASYDVVRQLTTDAAGHWVVAWYSDDTLGGTIGADFDILVSRSADNGATWTAPAALSTNAATDSGDDFTPQVTTDGLGNWVAIWSSHDTLGGTIGTDGDILVSRSTDNGATWTAPAALNTNAATDSGADLYPELTADGAGNWVAVWYSNESFAGSIGPDNDILVSRSTDNGATWTAPTALNTNAATDTGLDEQPKVTTDGAGNWVAVWYSNDTLAGTLGTDWDILVSRSTNNGATWTDPAALNTNAATDSGGDFNPQVATDGAGHWVAVWDSTDGPGRIGSDNDILFTRGTPDSDGDGLSDADEIAIYFTDSNNPDTDGDGLGDGAEVQTYLTNPTNPDTDGDGMNDGMEVDLGTNPKVSDNYAGPGGPINDMTTQTFQLVIGASNPPKQIADLDLGLNLTHTFDGDLNIRLTSPAGTQVLLVGGEGSNGQNFTNTRLDDEAAVSVVGASAPFTGSFRPESPLSTFDGQNLQGTWTLTIQDADLGESGTLINWTLYPRQKRSLVYLDFAGGGGIGSQASPFNTLANALPWVSSGGILRIQGATPTAPTTINQNVHLETGGGLVRIGAP